MAGVDGSNVLALRQQMLYCQMKRAGNGIGDEGGKTRPLRNPITRIAFNPSYGFPMKQTMIAWDRKRSTYSALLPYQAPPYPTRHPHTLLGLSILLGTPYPTRHPHTLLGTATLPGTATLLGTPYPTRHHIPY